MSSQKPIVLITGGNTGLGFEIVRALASSETPYHIIIGSRKTSNGDSAVESLKKDHPQTPCSFSVLAIDLESDSSITAARNAIASEFGHLDVLINNGGANFDGELQAGNLSLRAAWNKSWDVNVAGTMVLTSELVPLLLKSSAPRLMFLTSGTSAIAETENFEHPVAKRINASPEKGWPKPKAPNPITIYRSSKAGLNMAMRQWHRELLNDGVKVHAISPGFLATGLAGIGEEQLKKMGAIDPSVGGGFVKDVVEGKYDDQVGKVIRKDSIQPW